MGILKITPISFIVIIKEAQSIQYIHIAERIERVVIVPRVQFSNPSKAPLFVAFFLFVSSHIFFLFIFLTLLANHYFGNLNLCLL